MNVKIEKLIYGGEGLGHFEGATVFVPYVLPEEVVAIRPAERKKKFIRGSLTQVVTPSPDRVSPECPHFTACGGCHYQHIPYEAQLRFKSQILRETLARLGRIQWDGEIQVHASPPFGYRNRAQWKVRWFEEAGAHRGVVGYHRGGSSAVLAIEQCPILAPPLRQALRALSGAVAEHSFPQSLREVEAFCDPAGQALLLSASFTDFEGSGRKLLDKFREVIPQAQSILLHHSREDRFELDGPGFIHYSAAGHSYRVGHLSFFQVNCSLLDELVQVVIGSERGECAVDLFAGVGLFSIPLAKTFSRLLAVESNEAAVRDLRANADAAKVNVQTIAQDADRFLSHCKESPDVVILDPPRAGVGAEGCARLRKIGPQRISYLSCDPATLARDLATLTANPQDGAACFTIAEVHLFDIFPQTYHIETLVRLVRA